MNPAINFMNLQIGRLFHWNGEDYQKVSTLTARKLSTGRSVHMKKYEPVHIIAN
jgi:hypothetical protein